MRPGHASAQRDVHRETSASAYLGDTFTKGRLTLNLGVRWDHQKAANDASTAPANPAFPDLLPALVYDGSGPTINWNDISPRVELTYALDETRKTVAARVLLALRGPAHPDRRDHDQPGRRLLDLPGLPAGTTATATTSRRRTSADRPGSCTTTTSTPRNPTARQLDQQDRPELPREHDNEFIVGLDHELGGNFAVGAAYTWRKVTDIPGWFPRIGMTRGQLHRERRR